MPQRALASPYIALVERQCPPEAQAWWFQACRVAYEDAGGNRFAGAFAAAARRMGEEPVSLTSSERDALGVAGLCAAEDWSLGGFARIVLLLAGCDGANGGDAPTWVRHLFAKGDNQERQTILRALPLLPQAHRFVATAVEACRSHVRGVFEAIACDNPYPAAHFSDLQFEQLVLKALFVGAPLARIEGLEARTTPTLVRMAQDYASERRAAGRSVPADIQCIIGNDS